MFAGVEFDNATAMEVVKWEAFAIRQTTGEAHQRRERVIFELSMKGALPIAVSRNVKCDGFSGIGSGAQCILVFRT